MDKKCCLTEKIINGKVIQLKVLIFNIVNPISEPSAAHFSMRSMYVARSKFDSNLFVESE